MAETTSAADKAAADKAAADKAAEPAFTEARVLSEFDGNAPNSVVKLGAAELKRHLAAGHIDASPEAVAYAKSLA